MKHTPHTISYYITLRYIKRISLLWFLLILSPPDIFSEVHDSSCTEMTTRESLYIKSLDAFHFESRLAHPVLKVQLTFYNNSHRNMRITDGYFKVYLNPFRSDYKNHANSDSPLREMDKDLIGTDIENLNQKLYIGETSIAGGDLPASENIATDTEYIEIGSRSSATKIIEIRLPKSFEDRIRTIYLLMNYLGFPKSCKNFLLEGTATVGQESRNKGWSYLRNMDMNLILCPKTEHMEKNGILFH
ncbi:MAG: hypothetical protein V2I97_17110 [Desulfococcaceae bacterium]|nr:hypothetical protein [Desulfococcaceae bacterium]